MSLRIGSLFSGYGGLDLGVQSVLGGDVVWHCQYDPEDRHQYAARILAHHWPDVPNLGDISAVDWCVVLDTFGRVDVLIGGFPCTDLSSAGQRLGLAPGTRSGLWQHMLAAVAVLRPRLVVIENVRGILSTQAHCAVEPCPVCVEHAGGEPLLRALGAVLGDLAGVGFDAEWEGVRASDVGAPHERFREFVLVWPADAGGPGLEGGRVLGAVAERVAAVADAPDVGHERAGEARDGRPGPTDGGHAPADADGDAVREQPVGQRGCGGPALAGLTRSEAVADTASDGRREGRSEPAGQLGRPDTAERSSPAAADTSGRGREGHGEFPTGRDAVQQRVRDDAGRRDPAAPAADSGGRGTELNDVRPGEPDIAWGDYEPAIRRWETILGVPAPRPTDDRGRLAPEFSEWMQGVPGLITSVPGAPGMTEPQLRNARLKALGNGVVPLQASYAVSLLLARLGDVPAVHPFIDAALAMRAAA